MQHGRPSRRKKSACKPPARVPDFTGAFMKIKSISMLKYQRDDVWATVRDRLAEIVPLIDDIESITMQSREEGRDGVVRLVNIWKAKPKLPAIAAEYLKPDMLAWTDRAE